MMRVLHIGTECHGGAGLGMLRLHKDLMDQGIDSRILCLRTNEPLADDKIYSYLENPIVGGQYKRNLIAAVLNKLHLYSTPYYEYAREVKKLRRFHAMVSSPYVRLRVEESQLVCDADIIHLHWIANFVNYSTFFKKVKKPIVWTLRDENPALGFWHFKQDIPKELSSREMRLDTKLQRKKAKLIGCSRKMVTVSLSREEDGFFSETASFKGRCHCVIPNSIDGDVFYRKDRETTRAELGIKHNETMLIFVAQHLNEPRKGLLDLLSALSNISRNDIILVCVGSGDLPNTDFPGRIIQTGKMTETSKLAPLFSAADLFVSPSTAETFGKTLTEALACGTPVVSYPNAGAKDILFDKDMGILCSDFTVSSLINAINKALSVKYDPEIIRNKVLSRFSREQVVQAYVNLYKKLLNSN